MRRPRILSINLRCRAGAARYQGRAFVPADWPEAELEEWKDRGITHLWLLGVWPTSPASRRIFLEDARARAELDTAMPDWSGADVPGSPYAIADYQVDPAWGGAEGLNQLRRRLHRKGLKLLLDFVPNHLGLDGAVMDPTLFVSSDTERPGTMPHPVPDSTEVRYVAQGRDPWFPPWRDTRQLDIRQAPTREWLRRAALSVAEVCDGVRCDMAMLLLDDIFESTWRDWPLDHAPCREPFWPWLIGSVREAHPEFELLAEVYWDREAELLGQGFDWVYDKTPTDRLVAGDLPGWMDRLRPGPLCARGVRFLENHDEARAAASLDPVVHRLAALSLRVQPGGALEHDGQWEGRRFRVPVQWARWPEEPPDPEWVDFYRALHAGLKTTPVGWGTCDAVPTLESRPGRAAWLWRGAGFEWALAVVNGENEAWSGRVDGVETTGRSPFLNRLEKVWPGASTRWLGSGRMEWILPARSGALWCGAPPNLAGAI